MKTVTTKTITVQVVETSTTRWLDQCKAKLGGISDYALAPRLGIGRGQLSRYRNGKDALSDEVAIRVADILGIDPRPVIASAHADRAKDEGVRAFWQRWAAAGLAAIAIGGGGLGSPAPAQAQTTADSAPLSVMSNRRRKRRTTDAFRQVAETLIGLVLPQPPHAV